MEERDVSAARGFEFILFWTMALVGAATLAPCLVLPAWFEYQAAHEELAGRERLLAEQLAAHQRITVQIEHLKHDPAYNLRIAQQEFPDLGRGLQTVLIAPDTTEPLVEAAPGGLNPEISRPGDVAPEISEIVERLWERYPQAAIFARQDTRPVLMVLGAGLLLTAILLLGRPRGAVARLPAERVIEI